MQPPRASDVKPILIETASSRTRMYPPISTEVNYRAQVLGASVYWANIQRMFIITIIDSSIQMLEFGI